MPRSRDLPTAFAEHWKRHFAPPDGSPVVVAVSGGIDSMALLALLARERDGAPGPDVVAAHFDHRTRGRESADDGRLVAAVAAAWGARVARGSGDAPREAAAGSRGPMATARRLRYEFLADVAAREGAHAIVTAHHRDDRVETLLLRLVRGTSPSGLGGPGPIDDWRGTPVIRPLLRFSRAAIRGWAGRSGVPYREDPSNRDARYPRTRVREEVLPLLRGLNPRVDAAIVRLADLAATDTAWLQESTLDLLRSATLARDDGVWRLAAERLASAPTALLGRALIAFWSWSAPADSAPPGAAWVEGATEFLRGGRGGRIAVRGGGEIRRRGPEIVVRRTTRETEGEESLE